jgi:outer membrane protein TolC
VVNDPLLREAEYTRKATREARPQAWSAYLPQIGGQWTKTKAEESTNSLFPRLSNRIRMIRTRPWSSSSRRRWAVRA